MMSVTNTLVTGHNDFSVRSIILKTAPTKSFQDGTGNDLIILHALISLEALNTLRSLHRSVA